MMHKLEILAESLNYIEEHLHEAIRTEDIANHVFTSKSSLEKLFSYSCNVSVHHYVIRRKMTAAAFALIQYPQTSILDIALDYGYQSHEAFSRTFKEVFCCSPSEYRKTHSCKSPALYPRLNGPIMKGDDYLMGRRNFDISQLYDLFCSRYNCYFVCADICDMISINNISYKAGDLAILEALKRMDDCAGNEDIVFRIGGDEFCMLTSHTQEKNAQTIASALLAKNGNAFRYVETAIPLSLHVCCTKLDTEQKHLKYHELFASLHSAIKECKPEHK